MEHYLWSQCFGLGEIWLCYAGHLSGHSKDRPPRPRSLLGLLAPLLWCRRSKGVGSFKVSRGRHA